MSEEIKNTSRRAVWGTIQLKQKRKTPSHSHGVKTVSACSLRTSKLKKYQVFSVN